jgi:hypothetical protein
MDDSEARTHSLLSVEGRLLELGIRGRRAMIRI